MNIFFKGSGWLLLAAAILGCNTGVTSDEDVVAQVTKVNKSAQKNTNQPNVVLILIDDLSHYGVTAYGANRISSKGGEFNNQTFSTPNIDELAAGGLRVDRAYAYPLCENTRVAIMSGKRNDRNYLQPKSLHSSDITFGDAFKKAGYTTGLFGKWKQTRGTNEVSGKQYIGEFGWDDYAAFDVITEKQRFINPNLVINGEVHNYNGRTDVDPATGRRWYGPDIVNRHALAFIDKNKDKPFFLYYPMILVHDEHKPTPDTKPNTIFDGFTEKAEYTGTGGDDRTYFPDMIEYMDKLIGKVVVKLEQAGVRENTLIVVMGDNGTKETFLHILPDGTVWPARKGGNVENGLHVPLVLNYPGVIPHGSNGYRSYDGLVDITDIYPTIAQAANVVMPNADQVDGISMWPQALGEQSEPRDHIYTWFIGNYKYTDEQHILRYAFDKHFKRYAADADFPEGRFFDLRLDPLEQGGERFVTKKWSLRRYQGLDLSSLTPEQELAYKRLGNIIEEHAIKEVRSVSIDAPKTVLSVNERIQLSSVVSPLDATRAGVIWESSDPSIASINKLGVLTAHKAGKITVSIYSWEDAKPLANNSSQSYLKTGISDTVEIDIK